MIDSVNIDLHHYYFRMFTMCECDLLRWIFYLENDKKF